MLTAAIAILPILLSFTGTTNSIHLSFNEAFALDEKNIAFSDNYGLQKAVNDANSTSDSQSGSESNNINQVGNENVNNNQQNQNNNQGLTLSSSSGSPNPPPEEEDAGFMYVTASVENGFVSVIDTKDNVIPVLRYLLAITHLELHLTRYMRECM